MTLTNFLFSLAKTFFFLVSHIKTNSKNVNFFFPDLFFSYYVSHNYYFYFIFFKSPENDLKNKLRNFMEIRKPSFQLFSSHKHRRGHILDQTQKNGSPEKKKNYNNNNNKSSLVPLGFCGVQITLNEVYSAQNLFPYNNNNHQ